MSEPLNPYPGNFKRHQVVDDTDLEVLILRTNDMEGLQHVRDLYEASRAKDAELIQDLLDSLALLREVYQTSTGSPAPVGDSAIAAAEARGFKPTKP